MHTLPGTNAVYSFSSLARRRARLKMKPAESISSLLRENDLQHPLVLPILKDRP